MKPDTLKRLVRAKYVLQKSRLALGEDNEMAAALSLLLMHDAVELMMISILDELNVPTSDKRDFMEFWRPFWGRPKSYRQTKERCSN